VDNHHQWGWVLDIKKKVLFIVHDLFQSDNHFPVGIGYLAAVLQKNDVDVKVLSADVYHYSNAYVQSVILDWQPEVIGVGFLAARFNETVLPLCKAINEVKGDGKLIVGGHGASPIPRYVKEKLGADKAIIGEGEYWAGHDGDLDSLPFPAWDLFPIAQYSTSLKLPGWEVGDRTLGILTSRGCIGKCTFCYRMTKGLRLRSIENVIEEIKTLKARYGINYFFMQDELFVSSKKRMVEFAEALQRENIKIKYACDSRVNIISEELLDILKSSGCKYLDYGFESMDDNVLKIMKKGQTAQQNYNAAELTRKAGIPFNMNILWGNIGDTPETLDKSLEFIKEFDTCDNIRTIRPPTPYPGCELYDYAIKNGMLKGADDFFNKFTNSDRLTVNFTDMADDEFYALLYNANSFLVNRYHRSKAKSLSNSFHNLYFNNHPFRGARHYA